MQVKPPDGVKPCSHHSMLFSYDASSALHGATTDYHTIHAYYNTNISVSLWFDLVICVADVSVYCTFK